MSSRLTRAALVLVATATVGAGATGPASAAIWSQSDASGDVTYVTPPDYTTETLAPGDARDDIVRLRVAHNPRTVTIRLTTRAMPRIRQLLLADIRTPTRHYGTLPNGAHTEVVRLDGQGGCQVRAEKLDATQFRWQLTIPRACLGNPRWVRVGAALLVDQTVGSEERDYSDDALRSDTEPHSLGLSPRIHVG